jgi:hypothetical protein
MNIWRYFCMAKKQKDDGFSFQQGTARLEPVFFKVYAYAHGHCLNFNLRDERIGRK